jgi:hypothetical protein
MDTTDLRVETILQEGFREARADQLADPDDVCECGHVRDAHGPWRGCFDCGCRHFVEEYP